jgi:ATP adenylyltransferase/5',5'''-P-1,P-4-tetraphosphate phosphorylase II
MSEISKLITDIDNRLTKFENASYAIASTPSSPSRTKEGHRLWHEIKEVTTKAMASGALKVSPHTHFHSKAHTTCTFRTVQFAPTTTEMVIDGEDVHVQLRFAPILAQKPKNVDPAAKNRDPFLPYEKELFVTELFGTHNLLLNKFNVVPHHCLLTTVDFQLLDDLLNKKDFRAV